jgi:hypothetical protein
VALAVRPVPAAVPTSPTVRTLGVADQPEVDTLRGDAGTDDHRADRGGDLHRLGDP